MDSPSGSSRDGTPEMSLGKDANPWLILPYIVVIATAVIGINVTIVLSLGIVTAVILAVIDGRPLIELAGYMGAGVDSMGNLIIITLLAAGMLLSLIHI